MSDKIISKETVNDKSSYVISVKDKKVLAIYIVTM